MCWREAGSSCCCLKGLSHTVKLLINQDFFKESATFGIQDFRKSATYSDKRNSFNVFVIFPITHMETDGLKETLLKKNPRYRSGAEGF